MEPEQTAQPVSVGKVLLNDAKKRRAEVHVAVQPAVKPASFVIAPEPVDVVLAKPSALPEKTAAPAKLPAVKPAPVASAAPPVSPQPAPAVPASPVKPPAPQKPLSDDEVLRHTASLWRYQPIPSEAQEPDRMPEVYAMHMHPPAGAMYGARVRGKKHKHEGTNSDDWFAIDALGKIQLLAVADGAGSKHFSRIGAYAASEQAVKFLKEKLKERAASFETPTTFYAPLGEPTDGAAFGAAVQPLVQALQQAMQEARTAVEAAYKERASEPRYAEILHRDPVLADFSSTLLVAMALPAGTTGETLVLSCQIGDGMMAALDAAAPFAAAQHLLGKPDSGEYVGETEFLTSDRVTEMAALQNRTMLYRGRVTHLFAMTDGVADDYFPNEKEMRRLYCDLLANGVLLPPRDVLHGSAGKFEETLEEIRSLRKIKPVAFPWVNDKSVEVALHYTRRFAPTEDALAPYWADQRKLAMLAPDADIAPSAPVEQRIAKWLDNYTVRSSADDRTLVVAVREAQA